MLGIQSLPLSLLKDYLVCSRRAALKLVEGWIEFNVHAERGHKGDKHTDMRGHDRVAGVNLFRDLPVTRPLGFGEELVGILPGCYDGFLGYMKGLIPLLEGRRNGGFVC